MKISIVVPSFKNPGLLSFFLENLKRLEPFDFELLVVSDYSRTQIQEKIVSERHNAKFIGLPNWSGYTKVANIGIKEAGGEIVCLVNTDIVFLNPFIETMKMNFEDDPKLAVIGAKLYNTNGTIQHAGGYYIYGKKFVNYGDGQSEEQFKPHDRRYYPEEVTGAVFALRKKAWEEIGGFDEKYIFYNEDPEFCYQAWEKGYKVLYDPNIRAIHQRGGSTGWNNSKIQVLNIKSNALFEKRALSRPWNKIQTNIFNANKGNGPDPGLFIIERLGERGDLIQLTTTIRAIKRSYPEYEILVRTNYPEIFDGNPDVEAAGMVETPYARKLDFNVSAEKHLTETMSWGHWNTATNECGLNIGPFKQSKPIMYSTEGQWFGFLRRTGFNPNKKYAVVHQPITNFRSKTLPWVTWAETQSYLESIGLNVVIAGTPKDMGPLNSNMLDYRGKTDIHELRELIRHADLFVGVDSGPSNICQTTDTPGVVIFTSTAPEYILCSDNVIPVGPPEGKCRFCQQRQIPPCGYIDCPDGKNYECAKSININDIQSAIQGRLENA